MPSPQQMKMMLSAEGLSPFEETFSPDSHVGAHRHPFDEVRWIVAGQMVMDIAGNQVLLRAGDRIEVPSNTKHSMKAHGETDCLCLVAQRAF